MQEWKTNIFRAIFRQGLQPANLGVWTTDTRWILCSALPVGEINVQEYRPLRRQKALQVRLLEDRLSGRFHPWGKDAKPLSPKYKHQLAAIVKGHQIGSIQYL